MGTFQRFASSKLFDILFIAAELIVNRAGRDPDYVFAVSESLAKDAALIDGFLNIVKSLGVNADSADALFGDALAPKVVVNGNVIINGILKIISALNLDSVLASKPLFTDANKDVIAQNIDLFFGAYFDNYLPIARGGTEATTAAGARTNLDVYSKAEVDSLLAGKSNVGHTHGISLYTGTAGDPPHEHLVDGNTGA